MLLLLLLLRLPRLLLRLLRLLLLMLLRLLLLQPHSPLFSATRLVPDIERTIPPKRLRPYLAAPQSLLMIVLWAVLRPASPLYRPAIAARWHDHPASLPPKPATACRFLEHPLCHSPCQSPCHPARHLRRQCSTEIAPRMWRQTAALRPPRLPAPACRLFQAACWSASRYSIIGSLVHHLIP